MTAIPVVGEVPGDIVPVGIGLHLLQMPDQVPVVLSLVGLVHSLRYRIAQIVDF